VLKRPRFQRCEHRPRQQSCCERFVDFYQKMFGFSVVSQDQAGGIIRRHRGPLRDHGPAVQRRIRHALFDAAGANPWTATGLHVNCAAALSGSFLGTGQRTKILYHYRRSCRLKPSGSRREAKAILGAVRGFYDASSNRPKSGGGKFQKGTLAARTG
jgi:hypothetical protein